MDGGGVLFHFLKILRRDERHRRLILRRVESFQPFPNCHGGEGEGCVQVGGAVFIFSLFLCGFGCVAWACSQKAWNERIVIFANLSKNHLKIQIESAFTSLII